MIDKKIKEEFMQVKTGEEWNLFAKKYPDIKFSEIDEEMRQHFEDLVRSITPKEQLENPHIHYEVF